MLARIKLSILFSCFLKITLMIVLIWCGVQLRLCHQLFNVPEKHLKRILMPLWLCRARVEQIWTRNNWRLKDKPSLVINNFIKCKRRCQHRTYLSKGTKRMALNKREFLIGEIELQLSTTRCQSFERDISLLLEKEKDGELWSWSY